MSTRTNAILRAALLAAGLGLFVSIHSTVTSAQTPVDMSGLDILCKGKGDTYSPPVKGISSCIFADGQVIVCDSKKDECYEGKEPKAQALVRNDVMTLRLIKQLHDKIDLLTRQVQSLTAAGKK